MWQALASFHPRVVVVEYNAAFPPDVEWVVTYRENATWDGSQNFGASLRSFQLLGEQLGYNLVGCDFTGVNAFFVRTDLCDSKFASPFSAENHYEPPRYAALRDVVIPQGRLIVPYARMCTKLSVVIRHVSVRNT